MNVESTDGQTVQLMAMLHCSGRKLQFPGVDLMDSLSLPCHFTKIILLHHCVCVYCMCVYCMCIFNSHYR